MKQIHGKTVYDSLGEIVDPKHTALIVVDMQNDLCQFEGFSAKKGADISMIRAAIPKLARLLDEARRAGVLVVYLQLTDDKSAKYLSPAWLHFTAARKFLVGITEMTLEGTWGWEITPELRPVPGEPVVLKHRSDGFADTRLDSILRSNGIESVVVTGVATHGCVEATARGAACHDYYVVVPRDCVANREPELHEASLTAMAARFDVLPSEEILKAWSAVAVKASS